MLKIDNEMLNKQVSLIKQNAKGKIPLIVFKGFSKSFLDKLDIEKLTTTSLNISIGNLFGIKGELLTQVFTQMPLLQQKVVWCTFEEYQTITSDVLSLYFDISVQYNNMFYKTFPALYEIDNAEELYDLYFENEDVYQPKDHPSFELFTYYYGGLKKMDSEFYVTYIKETDDIPFYQIDNLEEIAPKEMGVYDEAFLELSEEEDEFLLLIKQLLEGDIQSGLIRITFSGDIESFPNRYIERISLLQYLFAGQVQFELISKIMESKALRDESEYLQILKQYWGYSSFRNLKMYSNATGLFHKKETITIPQSQIIDDIVQQAKRSMDGESYKDVFVTSPTGAGKSVMFQIPAIYLAEKYNLMTIVISPLIGLMVDQVQGLLKRNVEFSATINSEITPVQKMEIIEKIKDGKISILYISPETLLSRSDIKQLIGERKVGLFVIDEAHIVTTWGKAFRSDYWYLGGYLQKLRKEMHFPIATFTATAIYGGIEDMYSETRDSLNLINPISYFGYVKRDDLEIKIQKATNYNEKYKEYLADKYKVLLKRLEFFMKKKQKTLVYFPTVKLILGFYDFARDYGSAEFIENLSLYYGTLDKERKKANYLRYRNNDSTIMLATKAFGMGIDLPDIQNVYHFAPTGNVCDYIQEIGRAARDLDKGYAFFDFLPKDFVHVNRLHGISTIKKYQLVQVMDKIIKLFEKNQGVNRSRNMLISSDEFRYIFEKNNNEQNDDIDNKLKTALLIIEKDFKAKMQYSPIIARPRSIFAKEFIRIQKKKEQQILQNYGDFLTEIRKPSDKETDIYGGTYLLDMKAVWETRFKNISFPQFKYRFHQKDERLQLDFLDEIQPVLQLEMDLKDANLTAMKNKLSGLVDKVAQLMGEYATSNTFFSIEDFSLKLRMKTGKDKYFIENLSTILLYSAENFDRTLKKQRNFYHRFLRYDENQSKYSIQNSGYAEFIDWIRKETDWLFSNFNTSKINEGRYESFMPKTERYRIERLFILLGILEAMDLILFRVNGGDNPEIFLRINSILHLERVVKNPMKYENVILNNVYQRHKTSVAMLEYLFKREAKTQEFWDLIEDYFLGEMPQEVAAEVEKKKTVG